MAETMIKHPNGSVTVGLIPKDKPNPKPKAEAAQAAPAKGKKKKVAE